MAWQEDAKGIIENLLEDLQTPAFSGGALADMENCVKKSLELGLQTIDKIQEHEGRIEAVEDGYPIPNKIWAGAWSSGSLTPNLDAGHIVDSGDLADYSILIFVCHEVNGSDEDHSVHWMPQALWNFFDSDDKVNRITVGSHRLKMYFSGEEVLATDDENNDVEILEIWGIK